MADKKPEGIVEDTKVVSAVDYEALKTKYDQLTKDYQRVVAAFNRAVALIGNDYAEKVAKAIFDEIDKAAK